MNRFATLQTEIRILVQSICGENVKTMSSSSNKLQKLRKKAGFETAKAFAQELDVPTSTYARYEQSPDSIPLKAAWKIADILNCSIDEVVGRSTGSNKNESSRIAKRVKGLTRKYRESLLDYLAYLEEKSEEEQEDERKDMKKKIFSLLHQYERELHEASIEDEYFNKRLRTLGEDNYRDTLEEYIALQFDALVANNASSIAQDFVDHYRNQDPIQSLDEEGNVIAVYDPKKVASEDELKEMYRRLFKNLSKEMSEDGGKFIELLMTAYDQERSERRNAKNFVFIKKKNEHKE